MSILLLGFVAGFGAFLTVRNPERRWPPVLSVVLMGLLVVLQTCTASDRLASYQVRLLGQRFNVGAEEGGVPMRTGAVSGDRDRADIHVSGVGMDPIAEFEVVSDSSVFVVPASGNQGVVAVPTRRFLRRVRWSLLRSVAVEPDDRIRVRSDTVEAELTFERAPRWLKGTVDELVLRVREEGGVWGDAVRDTVPYPKAKSLLRRLWRERPTVWQRTYPLADLLKKAEAGVGSALNSFLYYDGDAARLAVLDDGVEVLTESKGSKKAVERLQVWMGAGSGVEPFRVAGLPFRDFQGPDFDAVERYGIRHLATFSARIDDDWLTVQKSRPDIHAVRGSEMVAERIDLRPKVDKTHEGVEAYSLRLSAGTGTRARVALALPANAFDAAAEAKLLLPYETTAGKFDLLTPSGFADLEAGKPFTWRDGERGLLLRVDGLGVSWEFVCLLLFLFSVAVIPFLVVRDASEAEAATRALALVAVALASLRLLLAISAKARFPFVDEGHEISLWLIPVIPSFVFVAGGALGRMAPSTREHGASRGWRELMGDAVPLFFLSAGLAFAAISLFPAIGEFPVLLLILASVVILLVGRCVVPVPLILNCLIECRGSRSFPGPGLRWGLFLFLLRFFLGWLGIQEQLHMGFRFGLSVLYTPVALLFFVRALAYHDHRVRSASSEKVMGVLTWSYIDLGSFLLFVYVLTSAVISDYGIALTTLPGPLLVLVWAGWRWSGHAGLRAVGIGWLPLIVFAAVQAAPEIPLWLLPGDVDVASRLETWGRDELLLLQRDNPEDLERIGESRSDALSMTHDVMRSYTRTNWFGYGFLEGHVSSQIQSTATFEHLVTALLASQWGAVGTIGLTLILVAVLLPMSLLPAPSSRRFPFDDLPVRIKDCVEQHPWIVPVVLVVGLCVFGLLPLPLQLLMLGVPLILVVVSWLRRWRWDWWEPVVCFWRWPCWRWDRWEPVACFWRWPWWRCDWWKPREESPPERFWILAFAALASFSSAGIYMVLANYGWVLFTGKNVYLLGLDSRSDTLEALLLIGMGAWAWTRWRELDRDSSVDGSGGDT